jgi:hypothetical protein
MYFVLPQIALTVLDNILKLCQSDKLLNFNLAEFIIVWNRFDLLQKEVNRNN